jgi:pentatricopeptide repeat protein
VQLVLRHDGCVVILTSLLAGVMRCCCDEGRGDKAVLKFFEIEEIGEKM